MIYFKVPGINPITSVREWQNFGTLVGKVEFQKTLTSDIASASSVNLYFPDDTYEELVPGSICKLVIDAVAATPETPVYAFVRVYSGWYTGYPTVTTSVENPTAADIMDLLEDQYPQYFEDLGQMYGSHTTVRCNDGVGYSYWVLYWTNEPEQDGEYFVVIDGGKVESQGPQTSKNHQYTIQELLAFTREMEVQTGVFSFGDYTLDQFFARLLALTDKDNTIVISLENDYQLMIDNFQGADYQIASAALLDNLMKIGSMLQVRFKAEYNVTSQIVTLRAYSMKGNETITTINGIQNGSSQTYQGANYASKVTSRVQNMVSDQYFWVPTPSPSWGNVVVPDEDYGQEITLQTAVLRVPHNFRKARKIRVHGYGFAITDAVAAEPGYTGSDYRVFTNDGTRIYADSGKYVQIDTSLKAPGTVYTEFEVLEENEYRLLDPDSSGGATRHQENTLYYKRGENKIRNMGICEGKIPSKTPIRSYYIETWYGGALINTTNVYQTMKWHLNRNIIEANQYNDGQLVLGNLIPKKRHAFYSQEENLTSGKSLHGNMVGYIESMNNKEMMKSYIFTDYNNIPKLGNIYQGMVLSTIVISYNYGFIIATLIFSDNLIPKSEYISADGGINLPDIPVGKAFERHTTYVTNFWFCKNASDAAELVALFGGDTYFNKTTYADRLLDAFNNGRTSPPAAILEAQLKMKAEDESTYIYTAQQIIFGAINSSIVVNFKTLDNAIIGTIQDQTIGTDFDELRYYPVAFINGNGKAAAMHLKLRTTKSTGSNYPAIAESTFNNTGAIVELNDASYHHDAAEQMNITYQLNGKTYGNNGKVYQTFFDDGSMFNDLYSNADEYYRKLVFTLPDGSVHALGPIQDVTVTMFSTYVALVSVKMLFASTVHELEGKAVITRVHQTTYEEKVMVVADATGYESGGNKYIEFYVAFTK